MNRPTVKSLRTPSEVLDCPEKQCLAQAFVGSQIRVQKYHLNNDRGYF